MHRDDRMIWSLRNWDKRFDRCISLASVTNVSYVRLSSRKEIIVQADATVRERKKMHRQALSIRIPRKFAEVDDSREMAASLKGYCARLQLKQLTWNCVHTARYVARIDIGWHKRWRQTERVTRKLTKEERKHACAARFSLPLFWKSAPCTLPSYKDKPLLILALSSSRKCHILTETLIRSGDFKCARRSFYTSSSDVIIQELHHYGS